MQRFLKSDKFDFSSIKSEGDETLNFERGFEKIETKTEDLRTFEVTPFRFIGSSLDQFNDHI